MILLFFTLLLPAWGGKKHEAERTRLVHEIESLSERNAWKGVDRAYERINWLREYRGVEMTAQDHLWGAQAARELGNTTETWRRLLRVMRVDPSNKAAWEGLARLEAHFGVADLTIGVRVPAEHIALQVKQMPFEPDKVRTIEMARKELVETRHYLGLLPLGQYALGNNQPGTVPFEIIGLDPVRVQLDVSKP